MGIIIRAKLQGLIPSATVVMRELQGAGLFLDEKTIIQSLERVGEEWEPT